MRTKSNQHKLQNYASTESSVQTNATPHSKPENNLRSRKGNCTSTTQQIPKSSDGSTHFPGGQSWRFASTTHIKQQRNSIFHGPRGGLRRWRAIPLDFEITEAAGDGAPSCRRWCWGRGRGGRRRSPLPGSRAAGGGTGVCGAVGSRVSHAAGTSGSRDHGGGDRAGGRVELGRGGGENPKKRSGKWREKQQPTGERGGGETGRSFWFFFLSLRLRWGGVATNFRAIGKSHSEIHQLKTWSGAPIQKFHKMSCFPQ